VESLFTASLRLSDFVQTQNKAKVLTPSKTRIQKLRYQLQGLRQGNKTCSNYIHTAKSLADHLAMVGKPVTDEDLISYIIGGLTPRYNAFITSFALLTKDESIPLEDFQTLHLSHEQLLNNQNAETEASSSFALHAQKSNHNPRKSKFNNGHRKNQSRFPNSKQNQTRFSSQFFRLSSTHLRRNFF